MKSLYKNMFFFWSPSLIACMSKH